MTTRKNVTNNGFMLFKDQLHLLECIDDASVGKAIKLLLKNIDTLEELEENNTTKLVYEMVATNIRRYREQSEIQREYGKRGGNPKLKKNIDNPTLKGEDNSTLKGEDNPTLKGTHKQQDKTRQDKTRKEKKRNIIIRDIYTDNTIQELKKYYEEKTNNKLYGKKSLELLNNLLEDLDDDVELVKQVIDKSAHKGHKINAEFKPLSFENMVKNANAILNDEYQLIGSGYTNVYGDECPW